MASNPIVSSAKAIAERTERNKDPNHIGIACISRLEVERRNAAWKRLDNQTEVLKTTTLEPKPSVDLGPYLRNGHPMFGPKYATANLLTKSGQNKVLLALAGNEGLSLRPFSGPAQAVALTIALNAKDKHTGLGAVADSLTFSAIKEVMDRTVYVGGGAQTTLGRFAVAYPKVGDRPNLRVPSHTEVARAAVRCGYGELTELRPHVIGGDGDLAVTVMKHSSNGYPTLGRFTDEEAANWSIDQAQAFNLEIAGVISQAADNPRDAVFRHIRKCEDQRPDMFLVQGKGKDDYLAADKALDRQVRFYNVVPRYLMLVMQQSTQTLGLPANHQTILTNPSEVRTAQGITLTHGGADRLVDALEPTVDEPVKYTHCGDDSWVVILVCGHIIMMSLDCSKFDLTQRSVITLPVDLKLHELLSRIDEGSAAVWYAMMRERRVVLTSTAVYQMRDGGPSGMPLQSQRNDFLMEITLNRFAEEIMDLLGTVEEHEVVDFAHALEALAADVAMGMGFSCRVDDTVIASPSDEGPMTLKTALKEHPFRFIGCIFHTVERFESTESGPRDIPDAATVMVDVPRTCAQMRFPRNVFRPNSDEFDVAEGIRLGSIVSSLGIPTPAFEESFAKARQQVGELLEGLLEKYEGNPGLLARKEAEAGLTDETVFLQGLFDDVAPGLRGMLKYLRSPPENAFLPDTKARPIQEVIDEIDARMQARVELHRRYLASTEEPEDFETMLAAKMGELDMQRRVEVLEAEVNHGLRAPPAFTGTMVPFRNRRVRKAQAVIRFSKADPRQQPTLRNLGRPPPVKYHARDWTQPRQSKSAASMQPEYDDEFDYLPSRVRKERRQRKGKGRK